MSDEKIEVGYRNIATMGGVDYHHRFLLKTDSSESLAMLADHDQRTESLAQAPAAPQRAEARGHEAPALSL